MNLVDGERRAAIVLGAAKFRKAPSLDRTGFSSSAEDFVSYLLDEHFFALPEARLLNLFDSEMSPGHQLERMCDFLDEFCDQTQVEGREIVLYYVGHGGFVGMNKEYFLAVAATKEGLEGSTAIRIGDLSSGLRDHAGQSRKYLILDCCFAASAFAQFQDPGLSDVIRSQTLEPLPPRGTALLCSSGSRQVSLSPSGQSHTLFSGALMEVLRNGERSGLIAFSLDDVGRRVKDLLRRRCPEDWIRPEVHSPDMREGNVAHIPIFPNPGFDATSAVTLSPGQADYVHNLESLLATRDVQLRQAMSSLEGHLEIAMEIVADTVNLRGAELDEVSRRARDLLKTRFPHGWTRVGLDAPDRQEIAAPAATPYPALSSNPSAASNNEDRLRTLESLLETRTEQLQEATSGPARSYDITLEAFGGALALKVGEPEGHSKRVTVFTIAIARAMGVPRQQIDTMARGAFLHDIGKMAIPDAILRKHGRLTSEEIAIMREHCDHGYRMLKKIPFLANASEIVYSHHELFDGTGYPRGLKGKEIPLGSRIFSVADTFDAITSDRRYRVAQSFRVALDRIREGAGTRFDPDVVRVFLEMPEKIWEDLRREVAAQGHRFNPPAVGKGPTGGPAVGPSSAVRADSS